MGNWDELDGNIASYYAKAKERIRLIVGSGRLELIRTDARIQPQGH